MFCRRPGLLTKLPIRAINTVIVKLYRKGASHQLVLLVDNHDLDI